MNLNRISAADLYAEHKKFAVELNQAMHVEIADEEIGDMEVIRDHLKVLEMEASMSEILNDEDKEYIQDVLSLKAEVTQGAIVEPKLAIRTIRTLGARARLNIHNIFASEVYRDKNQKWHQEALDEFQAL